MSLTSLGTINPLDSPSRAFAHAMRRRTGLKCIPFWNLALAGSFGDPDYGLCKLPEKNGLDWCNEFGTVRAYSDSVRRLTEEPRYANENTSRLGR
jgi:hypothetical protein